MCLVCVFFSRCFVFTPPDDEDFCARSYFSLSTSKIWRTKTMSLSFSRCLPLVLLCLRFSLLFHPLLLSNRVLRASTLNIPVSSTSSRGFYDGRNTESPGSPRRIFLPNRPVIAWLKKSVFVKHIECCCCVSKERTRERERPKTDRHITSSVKRENLRSTTPREKEYEFSTKSSLRSSRVAKTASRYLRRRTRRSTRGTWAFATSILCI